MQRRVLPAVGIALALSACAGYQPKPIEPDLVAASIEARSLTDSRLRHFIVAVTGREPDAWDLNALTLAALYFHPDIEIARAKLAVATAGQTTAGSHPNPTIGLTPTKHTNIVDPSSWTIGLIADFVIELSGQTEYRTAQARALADAARLDIATAGWTVRAGVRQAMLAMWRGQTRQASLDRRRTIQTELVGLLEKRLAAGESSVSEVARERAILKSAVTAVREEERGIDRARTELAVALGVPSSAIEALTISLSAFDRPVEPPDGLTAGPVRRAALVGRSDVQSLLAEYQAAEAALQLEIAQQFPDLSLSPGYAFDQGDNLYSLGVSAKLPIFNRNEGPIAEAEARRRQVEARFTALQTKIVGDIDLAVADWRDASSRLRDADAALAAEKTRATGIAKQFSAGAIDRPTLLSADLDLAAAELSRVDAVAARLQALERLEDALHQPLFDPQAAPFVQGDLATRLEHGS